MGERHVDMLATRQCVGRMEEERGAESGALRKWPAMVNHSSKKATTINCELTDPVFGEFAEPYLEILEGLSAETMLYCDYGEEYWKGREHGVVEGTFS